MTVEYLELRILDDSYRPRLKRKYEINTKGIKIMLKELELHGVNLFSYIKRIKKEEGKGKIWEGW